jgi:hypothetical protein
MAAAAALVTAGVAACGTSGPGAGQSMRGTAAKGAAAPGHVVQAAYLATTNAKTAAFRLDETIRTANSGGSSRNLTITGSGQADFATRAFTISMNVPMVGAIKMTEVNGTEYIQVPAAERGQIPGHKPWLSLNLNKISQAKLGGPFSQFASASNGNPTQALSQLSAVSSRVSRVGSATVAGVPTTEYRAEVSLAKVAARMRATQGMQAAQAVRQQMKTLHTSTLPVDVWIGAHHLIRQIRYQAPAPAAGSKGTVVATLTLSKFGVPVHLSPPPASQTTDITNQVIQRAPTG